MRKASRSMLVPYTAEQMYTLAADVEAYPEFLPWCERADVLLRDGEHVEAELEMRRGSISKTFKTRNRLVENTSITMSLLEGPFRKLDGHWEFQSLGDEGSKVSLDVEFAFDSRVTDMLFGRFFEETCNRLVDAFTKRAEQVYGGGQ